jgi:hypothetical protein
VSDLLKIRDERLKREQEAEEKRKAAKAREAKPAPPKREKPAPVPKQPVKRLDGIALVNRIISIKPQPGFKAFYDVLLRNKGEVSATITNWLVKIIRDMLAEGYEL